MSIAVNNFKALVKGNPIDKIIQAINFLQPNSIEELKIKARKWMQENKDNYITDIEGETIVDAAIIEDFLKAMEE